MKASLAVLRPSKGLSVRAKADMHQTAGAWVWWVQARTCQHDATRSAAVWLLFWERLVGDVMGLNAGQGWG